MPVALPKTKTASIYSSVGVGLFACVVVVMVAFVINCCNINTSSMMKLESCSLGSHDSHHTHLAHYQWPSISMSAQDIKDFHADGFLIIRNAIPVEIIDGILAHKPKHSLSWYLRPIEYVMSSVTNSDYTFDSMWTHVDFYRDFWYFSPIVHQIVAKLLFSKNNYTYNQSHTDETTSDSIRLLTDILFGIRSKPLVFGEYHQDLSTFGFVNSAAVGLSVWIPLMDIDARMNGGSIFLVNQSSRLLPEYCRRNHGTSVQHSSSSSSSSFVTAVDRKQKCIQLFDEYTNTSTDANTLTYMSQTANANPNANDLIFLSDYHKGDILLFDKFTFHKSQPLKHIRHKRVAYVGRFADGNAHLRDNDENDGGGDQYVATAIQKKNACAHGLDAGDRIHTACYPQLYPTRIESETNARMDDNCAFHALFYPHNDWHFFCNVFKAIHATAVNRNGVRSTHASTQNTGHKQKDENEGEDGKTQMG